MHYSFILSALAYSIAEVAEKVLDKCIEYPLDIDMKDTDLKLDFDMEFIDDTYTCTHWGDPELLDIYNAKSMNIHHFIM